MMGRHVIHTRCITQACHKGKKGASVGPRKVIDCTLLYIVHVNAVRWVEREGWGHCSGRLGIKALLLPLCLRCCLLCLQHLWTHGTSSQSNQHRWLQLLAPSPCIGGGQSQCEAVGKENCRCNMHIWLKRPTHSEVTMLKMHLTVTVCWKRNKCQVGRLQLSERGRKSGSAGQGEEDADEGVKDHFHARRRLTTRCH